MPKPRTRSEFVPVRFLKTTDTYFLQNPGLLPLPMHAHPQWFKPGSPPGVHLGYPETPVNCSNPKDGQAKYKKKAQGGWLFFWKKWTSKNCVSNMYGVFMFLLLILFKCWDVHFLLLDLCWNDSTSLDINHTNEDQIYNILSGQNK